MIYRISSRQRRQTLKPSENRWVRIRKGSVAEGDQQNFKRLFDAFSVGFSHSYLPKVSAKRFNLGLYYLSPLATGNNATTN